MNLLTSLFFKSELKISFLQQEGKKKKKPKLKNLCTHSIDLTNDLSMS
jgi:hypothetical protein